MKKYVCDGPDCKESTDYDIKDGWMKMKLSCYCDNSIHTGWIDRDTMYLCPKCSKALVEFLRDKNVPSIDLKQLVGDKTVTVKEFEIDNHDIKKRNHNDKGYIWE